MFVAMLSLISLLIGPQRGGALPSRPPVATVHGHVILQETGMPVALVSVWLVSDTFAEDGFPETKRISSALSDVNGEYWLPAPAAGSYSVMAPTTEKSFFVPGSKSQRIQLGKDESLNVDIFVAAGKRVTVAGRLIDGLGHR